MADPLNPVRMPMSRRVKTERHSISTTRTRVRGRVVLVPTWRTLVRNIGSGGLENKGALTIVCQGELL